MGNAYNDGYEAGAEEAFRIARKIVTCEGISIKDAFNLFESRYLTDILSKYSVEEIIQKMQNYEKEKENEFHVGEEVEVIGSEIKFIITRIAEAFVDEIKCEVCFGFNSKTGSIETTPLINCKKTGRYFDCIAKIIGGENVSDN